MCVKTVFRFSAFAFFLVALITWCFSGYVPASSGQAGNAVAEFEPAVAVRGSACITCYAKIQPAFITDFGKSVFEFDPVFKKVPVLPMLKASDYLQVE